MAGLTYSSQSEANSRAGGTVLTLLLRIHVYALFSPIMISSFLKLLFMSFTTRLCKEA